MWNIYIWDNKYLCIMYIPTYYKILFNNRQSILQPIFELLRYHKTTLAYQQEL